MKRFILKQNVHVKEILIKVDLINPESVTTQII